MGKMDKLFTGSVRCTMDTYGDFVTVEVYVNEVLEKTEVLQTLDGPEVFLISADRPVLQSEKMRIKFTPGGLGCKVFEICYGEFMIDTGDAILHKPTGETWLVSHCENGYVTCCGWPESSAPVGYCELKRKATPEQRLRLLNDLAKGTGRRATHAQHTLGKET